MTLGGVHFSTPRRLKIRIIIPAIALLLLVKQAGAIDLRIETISPSWDFTNTENQAVFRYNFERPIVEGYYDVLRFRLHEPFAYLSLNAFMEGSGTASFSSQITNNWADILPVEQYVSKEWNGESSTFSYAATGTLPGTGLDTGLPADGDRPLETWYYFIPRAVAAAGSTLSGWVEYTLTRPNQDVYSVPDTGSTLLLLVGGFVVLHFFARKFGFDASG
jgi:hypothetical protein